MFFIFSLTSSCSLISNYSIQISVDKVIDGDTFETNNEKYRILGIDTPELNEDSNIQYFYAQIAKEKAIKLLQNRFVVYEHFKNDKYDRKIVKITLDNGQDFASYMIENGYGIVRYISKNKSNPFYYYDHEYIDNLYNLQDKAEKNKAGFWNESIENIKKIYS
ncbi:MAG: thermonuclease family protein [Mycoplasmataceae bacterium]|nr:thermonuclease family protein [Mycoplasmataceae bacterium]MBR2055809.1 thermonuclease family protein [Mycoplasmataceae bacterium]MBR2998773.1 thermonuclease family protein [Mycoplasmataceae bacterium]MBR4025784.1 thermonuclease family protein [Mycoplasmataceae bacterium]